MDTAQKPKARLVAIGRHFVSCLSANDYIEIGERRWHALHARAQEMLEDARAESEQRVAHMKEIYALRDETVRLALQHGSTVEGAVEVIQHACAKAKIDGSDALAQIQPDDLVTTALALFGVDVAAVDSNPKR